MALPTLWFIIIAFLFIGYFVLEGFDFGVGMLMPFLGKNDTQRRIVINTIGPHWDGNEVWLITAGAGMFAAFPGWYATLFSGFYLPLFLLLVGLIIRGVAFEFRSKEEGSRWRKTWDWILFTGSAIPALLWGVAFANFIRGVPINENQNYVGGFWNLLNPYALVGGLVTVTGFLLIGAVYLTLKTSGELRERSRRAAIWLWLPAVVVLVIFTIMTYLQTDILTKLGVNPGAVPIGALLTLLISVYFIRERQEGWAFAMLASSIVLATATAFLLLYPRVLISSLNPAYTLTIFNTASGQTTLRTMTTITLIFLPIVLIYEGWSYWVFRKRLTEKAEGLEY